MPHDGQHLVGTVFQGEAANAGAEGRHGQGSEAELVRQDEGALGGAGNVALAGDEVRPHDGGVNDIAGVELSGRRGDGLSGRDGALRNGLSLDLGATASLEGPGDPRSHPQVAVGGVDDGVGGLGGDVALGDMERDAAELKGSGHDGVNGRATGRSRAVP